MLLVSSSKIGIKHHLRVEFVLQVGRLEHRKVVAEVCSIRVQETVEILVVLQITTERLILLEGRIRKLLRLNERIVDGTGLRKMLTCCSGVQVRG